MMATVFIWNAEKYGTKNFVFGHISWKTFHSTKNEVFLQIWLRLLKKYFMEKFIFWPAFIDFS